MCKRERCCTVAPGMVHPLTPSPGTRVIDCTEALENECVSETETEMTLGLLLACEVSILWLIPRWSLMLKRYTIELGDTVVSDLKTGDV